MDALAMDRGMADLRHALEQGMSALAQRMDALEQRMDAIERSVTELRQDWRRMDNRLWALLLLAVGGILTPIVLKTL